MSARDVAVGQLDAVSAVAADGDFVLHERDDGLAPFVVLDDELHGALRRQAPSA